MALNSINTNISALSAQQNINSANRLTGGSIARLSSGDRIIRAADDVAGLSVGTALRTEVTTLRQALVNSNQANSLLQVADGALAQVTDILQRQKSIAVQAGSGSLTDTERGFLNQEFQALAQEIDRIVDSTNFNGVGLIGGGLGNASTLIDTDAQVATIDFNTTNAAVTNSAVSIQAFNTTTGVELQGVAAPGEVELVAADGTTPLANGEYLGVNSAVIGSFESFSLSDVTFGAANVGTATLTASINGTEFTGNVVAGATSVVVSNGNTRIALGVTAIALTDAGTVALSEAQIDQDFVSTEILRTSSLGGVDFAGTALQGAVGNAAFGGNASVRVGTSGDVDISNFNYVSGAAANQNILTVEVNGETFTATAVTDQIDATTNIVFTNGAQDAVNINLTGIAAPDTIANIRADAGDREAFLNALNVGFSRSGGGLNFAVGSSADDSIRVQIDDASTTSLYAGQSLTVASAAEADVASSAIDIALDNLTAIRADVGALQSRFDFASAQVESAIQNQDAARGTFLDADISAESTAFASAQVQLQAGISVLAQANLLPQNLLKLIG